MVGLKPYLTGEAIKILLTSILVTLSLAIPAAVRTGNQTLDRWQMIFLTMVAVWIVAVCMAYLIGIWRKW